MKLAAELVVGLVAALHFWFMILEMFFWRKPLGLKTFGNTPEKAQVTQVLAANQGLYNGFLATGLVTSFLLTDLATAFSFRVFFLACVVVAGLYGAWSVGSRRILMIQAAPAAWGLLLICFAANLI